MWPYLAPKGLFTLRKHQRHTTYKEEVFVLPGASGVSLCDCSHPLLLELVEIS